MAGCGKRILVVDEDADCQALVEAQLQEAGYAVETPCDGVEGLDKLRKQCFDAIITDCCMPGFIGHEFAGFCRIAWPDTPLILLCGNAAFMLGHAEKVDAVTCIRKPYEAAMLLTALRLATHPVLTEQPIFSMAEMAH